MRYRKTIKWMIAVLAVTGAAIIYFLYEPQQHDFFLFCPLHHFTGLKCPLCGLQQMTHHLLHGQWVAAFNVNPFLFLLLPYVFTYLYLNLFKKKADYPKLYRALYGDRTLLWLLIIAALFAVVRNWGW